jgi:hypothetical protein
LTCRTRQARVRAEAREGGRSPTRVLCHKSMIFLQTPCPEIISSLHADNEKCDTATATLGGNLCPQLIVSTFLCSVSMRSSSLGSTSLPPRGQHSSRACLSFCLERAGQKASLENAINAHEQKIRDFLMSCGGTGEVRGRIGSHVYARAHTHTHTERVHSRRVQLRKRVVCVDVEREGRGSAGTSMAV